MSTVAPPKVSVITPSFNQGRFIEETILSIQSQSYPNLEHIVVDGGSTDGTLGILGKNFGKIKWISEKDRGQAHAINKGFRMAQGEIIGWLNSDDIYFNGAMRQVINIFTNEPTIDVLYGDYIYIDDHGQKLKEERLINFDLKILLYDGCFIGQPAVFFKRKVFESVGYIDEALHFAIDWEYWLRLYFSGCRFYHLPRFLSGYRLHVKSKTMNQSQALLDEEELVRNKYSARINNGNCKRNYLVRKYHRFRKRAVQLWHQNIIEFPRMDSIVRNRCEKYS